MSDFFIAENKYFISDSYLQHYEKQLWIQHGDMTSQVYINSLLSEYWDENEITSFIKQYQSHLDNQESIYAFLEQAVEKYNIEIYIHQQEVLHLIETNSTRQRVVDLCNAIMRKDPENHIFLLYVARFIGRSLYGKTKEVRYALLSEEILFQVIAIEQKYNKNWFSPYGWLAMLYFYLWKYDEAQKYLKYAYEKVQCKREEIQLSEWHAGMLLKEEKYEEALTILEPLEDLTLRWYVYMATAYYHVWNEWKNERIFFASTPYFVLWRR